MISFSAAVIGFVIFLGMLFLAIPVALSIFFTCLLAAVMYVGLPSLTTFGSTAWSTLNNFILTAISNFLTGLKLSDMETGLKCFRKKAIQSINLIENRFGLPATKWLRVFKPLVK